MTTLKRMLALLKPYRWTFAMGQTMMLLATACGLAYPLVVRQIFDTPSGAANGSGWLLWIGILGACFLVGQAATYFKDWNLGRVGEQIVRDLRERGYQSLLAQELGFYDRRDSGKLASTLTNDITLLQDRIASGLAFMVQQVVSLIVVTVMLVRIDPLLTLAVAALIPAVLLVSRAMGKRSKAISQSTQEQLAGLLSITSQSIAGIGVIKAYVLEKRAMALYRGQNARALDRSLAGRRVAVSTALVVGIVDVLFTLATLGLGAYRVSLGAMSPADLLAFVLYAEMIVRPIAALSSLYVEINKAAAAYERVAAVIDSPQVEQGAGDLRPETIVGRVTFDGVGFGYGEGARVLDGVDLDVQAGETIALVGPSGVGKSTLIKLLPRFYRATAGQVRIDGLPLDDLDVTWLRDKMAIVPQDTYLFDLSIRDNIALGNPDTDEEALRNVARLANADGFIRALDEGYDTQVGEGGGRLSGGQRQRIAIARAFLRDPRILILDEATSALDAQAEASVQEALERLRAGRTTFVIAHRLATVMDADRIVVLGEGGIEAVGGHEQLLATCPYYREAFERQMRVAA